MLEFKVKSGGKVWEKTLQDTRWKKIMERKVKKVKTSGKNLAG